MKLRKAEQLARLIHYMAGRHPDTFGLVPDGQGFIPVAEMLKAIQEEGWSGVRRKDLTVLSYHLGRPVMEFQDHLVRASDRSRIDELREPDEYPGLLYAPVRRRAYETVKQHGLRPHGHPGKVVLYATRELARRVGRRKDAEPVIVTVAVKQSQGMGKTFQQFGENIFLTDALPPECCQLPRPPQILKRQAKEPPVAPKPTPKTPGSYIVDMEPLGESQARGTPGDHRRKTKAWKKDRRRARQWKARRHSSE
jgi:putative RNA 2'-phosphotransferase